MSIERFPEHPKNPVIFAANHQFSLLLHPRLVEINRQYKENDILFLCDAAYGWALDCYGLKTIKMDTRPKIKHIRNPVDRLKQKLTTLFGESIGAYRYSLSGLDSINIMTNELKKGRDIFLFPEGRTGKDIPWNNGIGNITKVSDRSTTSIVFVYIPKDIRNETKISFTPVIGSLIKFDDNFHPKKIAAMLQVEYNLRK